MNSRRPSNVGCFFVDKYLILLALTLVFGAQCAAEAKYKQGQDYEPTCGHK